jgi:hypothetical protein
MWVGPTGNEPLDPDTGVAIAKNYRGQWVPGIPLPMYGIRKKCECGNVFWTEKGYRGHYALIHILGL